MIADVDQFMSLFRHIGVPVETFSLYWGRKADLFDPWRIAGEGR